MEHLLNGFLIVMQPMNILMMLIGAVLGMIIGIVPGIAGPMGVALLIPFTFTMEPIQGILIMLALYVTSTYGASDPLPGLLKLTLIVLCANSM